VTADLAICEPELPPAAPKPVDTTQSDVLSMPISNGKARGMQGISVSQLTRHQQQLLDASTAIRTDLHAWINFLHAVQCQCGIPPFYTDLR
jgi:hypothetical protein